MKYRIELSNSAAKAIRKGILTRERLLDAIDRFICWVAGKDINVDVEKLEGVWSGSYRIRIGRIRVIILIDYEKHSIFVDRIDLRGNVYKK